MLFFISANKWRTEILKKNVAKNKLSVSFVLILFAASLSTKQNMFIFFSSRCLVWACSLIGISVIPKQTSIGKRKKVLIKQWRCVLVGWFGSILPVPSCVQHFIFFFCSFFCSFVCSNLALNLLSYSQLQLWRYQFRKWNPSFCAVSAISDANVRLTMFSLCCSLFGWN